MIRVSFDTPRFRFEAYGATREQAKAALWRGLVAHCKQYDMGPFEDTDLARWFADDDNMWFADIRAGMALRDNSELVK